MEKFNLNEKLGKIREHWHPAIVAELNEQYVKLAKLKGDFVWHHHQEEDELFLVIDGSLEMHFRDKVVMLEKGDCIVVPKGVEHKPVAREEAAILLFEPKGTINTGNARKSEFFKDKLDRI